MAGGVADAAAAQEGRRLTPIDEFTGLSKAWTQAVGGVAKLLPPGGNSGAYHCAVELDGHVTTIQLLDCDDA